MEYEITAHFAKDKPFWDNELSRNIPVYAVPLSVLDYLSNTCIPDAKPKAPTLNEDEVERERSFTNFCLANNAIGLWGETLLRSELPLAPVFPGVTNLSDELITSAYYIPGHTIKQKRGVLKEMNARMEKSRRIRIAYIGWLRTNPVFIDEVKSLLDGWEHKGTPEFYPLSRPIIKKDHEQTSVPLSKAEEEWNHKLSEFLGRWCLQSLVTPDLPNPQGVLSNQSAIAFAKNNSGHTVYVPAYRPLVTDDPVLEDIKDNQRLIYTNEKPRSIEGDSWPIKHHDMYANIAIAAHIRDTLKRRHERFEKRKFCYTHMYRAIYVYLAKWDAQDNDVGASSDKEMADIKKAANDKVRKILTLADKRVSGTLPMNLR